MSKLTTILFLVFCVMAIVASPAMAQDGTSSAIDFSAVGVGLSVIGGGYGIGRLAASAYEGMARQPEMAGLIQTAMLIAAALIEGLTFFALFICWKG